MKEEVLIIKNKKVIGKFMAKIMKTDKNTGKLKDGRKVVKKDNKWCYFPE